MLDIKILKRQHDEIYNVILGLKERMEAEGDLESKAFEIAQKINLLSGKLKIHLGTEDRYLYPYLLEKGSDELRKVAEDYVTEMGDISNKFSLYKSRFNTKSKIVNDLKSFVPETAKILKVIKERIMKEDVNLYKVLSS